ncbi:g1036 [Coccomyxa elongata]
MSSLIDFFTDDRDVIISYKWAWVYIIAGVLVALTILMVQWLTTPSIAEITPSDVVRQDNPARLAWCNEGPESLEHTRRATMIGSLTKRYEEN